jgi:hypothetical protein
MDRSRLLFAGLSVFAFSVAGCGREANEAAPQVEQVTSALSATATASFGFESLSNWTISSGKAALGTPRTQGQTALQLTGPVNFTTITSKPTALTAADLAPLTQPGAFIAIDMALPTQQPNPNWFGTTQMYVNCQARAVYSQFLGQIELSGRRLGNFQTYRFAVPTSVQQLLSGHDCSNFILTFIINVPSTGTGTYSVDNLRFKSGSDASSTGTGASVDLLALLTANPVVSTPGTATFTEGRVQVPDTFHVAKGSAGNGQLTLLLADSATDRTTCTYAGGDSGASYKFVSCSRGEKAGDLVIATSAKLTIVSRDISAGDTKVKAQLAINPTGDELVSGLTPIPTFWGDNAAQVGAISGAYFQRVAQNPQGGANVTLTEPAIGTRAANPIRIRNLLDPNSPPLVPNDPPLNQYGDVGGSDLANAYWKLTGNIDGQAPADGSFTTNVDATGTVHGVLLGFDQEVLTGHVVYNSNSGVVTATGRTGGSATGHADVLLFGNTVASQSLNQSFAKTTLFSDTEGFSLPVISFGIFSVNVGLSATVDVTMQTSAQVDGVSLTLTPQAVVTGSVSADVNILVASGGISANVEIINLELPINVAAVWGIDTNPGNCHGVLAFNINANATVSVGAGSIQAHVTFGNCSFFGLCDRESWTITHWGPLLQTTVPFINIDENPAATIPLPTAICDLPLNLSTQCVGDNETIVAGLGVAFGANAEGAPHQTPCPPTMPDCLQLNIPTPIPCAQRTWTTDDPGATIALLQDDGGGLCPTAITFSTVAAPTQRTVTMTATDGFTPTTVTKTVNVVPPSGTAPFVRILLPPQGCPTSYPTDAPLALLASAVDPNGGAITFAWDQGTPPATFSPIATGNPASWAGTPSDDATTDIRVAATSPGGTTTASTGVTFVAPPR